MSHFLSVDLLFVQNKFFETAVSHFFLLNFEYFLDSTKKTHTKITGLGLI